MAKPHAERGPVLGDTLQRGFDVYLGQMKCDMLSAELDVESFERMWETFRSCLDGQGSFGGLVTLKVGDRYTH